MKKLDESYYDYEDLGDEIEMELGILGGFVFIDTPLERLEVNITELRTDGVPRAIMEYLINERPGEVVSISEIRDKAKIPTSQNLQQLIRKMGFKGYTRSIFIPIFRKDEIKVLVNVKLPLLDARLVLDELE